MDSFDTHGAQYAWDATSIKLAEECMRKYYYRMIEGWQPHQKGVDLVWGGLYASALEHFHKALARGIAREDALREVVRATLEATWQRLACAKCQGRGDEGCEACNGTGTLPHGGSPVEFLHNAKTRENLIRTIIWYVDHFEDDPLETVYLADGKPAVELSFSFEVDDGIVFCGHIDRLVKYGDDYYPTDQKTTGTTISPTWFAQFSPDSQMSMYTFATKIILDQPAKGIIVDAAQIAVGFSKFERSFINRTQSELDEWYEETLTLIARVRNATLSLAEGMPMEKAFPRNPSACGHYRGCEFRDVCGHAPELRDNYLRAGFRKGERWNPLKKR